MKKTYKIIMLPTDDISGLYLKGDKLYISGTVTDGQHLYILSNEEIKKGDWFCDKRFPKNYPPIFNLNDINMQVLPIFCKKIIASTNKFLDLPSIQEEYIKYWIEEYNKGNILETIELKLQDVIVHQKAKISLNEKENKPLITEVKLKIQNNEVCPVIPPDYSNIKAKFLNKQVALKYDTHGMNKGYCLGKVVKFYLGTDDWLYCITDKKHQFRHSDLCLSESEYDYTKLPMNPNPNAPNWMNGENTIKTTQDLSEECIKNIPYEKALKLADKEGYVYCTGFGKIHINNWENPNTIEQAAEYWSEHGDTNNDICYFSKKDFNVAMEAIKRAFIAGAKYEEAEKHHTKGMRYSEEEVFKIAELAYHKGRLNSTLNMPEFIAWFEQIKNK